MSKKIGILGFGVVGKSVLKFLRSFYPKVQVGVWDQRKLEPSELELIRNFKATLFDSSDVDVKTFFKNHDQIIISPGVNLRKFFEPHDFAFFSNKCIGELDFLAQHFTKPTIAVTGTLGKTTITKLLGQLTSKKVFQQNGFENVVMGGNIGDAMLNLVSRQEEIDLAVLELSSFQLDLNKKFAPTVAIWTNFYPNHLDWHSDLHDYFAAKFKVFEYQMEGQIAIFPLKILSLEPKFLEKVKSIKAKICLICESLGEGLSLVQKLELKNCELFGPCDNQFCVLKTNNTNLEKREALFDLKYLPKVSFVENWFFVLAALYSLNLDLRILEKYFQEKELFFEDEKFCEHRVELFTSINGIDFYNDSKATVVQATQAALKKLEKNNKPIILILGGLNKGIDRSAFFNSLSNLNNLKKVFFLGKYSRESEPFQVYSSLQDVLHDIFQIAKPGDQVLFSPSGSSFDFFKDYQHRGTVFKELVLSYNRS